MPSVSEDFLQFLVQKGVLQETQARSIRADIERTGLPPQKLLFESGLLSEEDAYRLRSEFLQIPLAVLPDKLSTPVDVLRMISEDAVRRYGFVPLKREGGTLHIGMLAPEDVIAQEALRFFLSHERLRANIFLITPTAFQAILSQYRPFHGEVEEALTKIDLALGENEQAAGVRKRGKSEELYAEAPVIKMVSVILRQAFEGKASDVHIEPSTSRLRVRFRVDGILYTSLFLPMTVHSSIASRIKILANLKIDETRRAQDGRFRATFDGKPIDFRVATLPTAFGEKVAVRLLDPSVGLRTFEELGLVGQARRAVEEALKRPFGMVLITGPTGSGKTTTLYAFVQTLRRDEANIVTLEDPVEYFIDGINQSQVNEEIGYTFASGLRHILRGDPNIILVGEIRDAETATLAVQAGLTGHLLLSTLHTNNAVGIIPRLLDLGVDSFLIPSTVLIGVSQRLVRHLCDDCKKPRDPMPKERAFIEEALSDIPEKELKILSREWKLWEAPGCDACGHSGTRGRIAVFEVLRMTRELEMVILGVASEARIVDEAKRQGMVTMLQDGLRKVLGGLISFDELLRVVEEKEELTA